MSKYDKASLVHIPSGYKSGTLYNVLPNDADGDFDFTRASTATRVNKDGLIETVATGTPRLDYPLLDGVVQDNPTLLLEPSRTQLAEYTNAISSANGYILTDGTLTTNDNTAPDGSNEASTFEATSANGQFQKVKLGSSGVQYTVSAYVKRKTGTGKVYLRAVENTNTEVTIYDYWTRVSLTVTSTSTSIRYGIALETSGDEVYVWGFQVEAGSYPTSLIPNTSTGEITRSADAANGAGTAADFNDSEGVVYLNIKPIALDGTHKRITLSDGTSTNRIIMGIDNSNNVLATVYDGTNQAVLGGNYNGKDDLQKVALKYKTNDFSLHYNGFKVATDTSGNTFAADTLNQFRFEDGNGSLDFYGIVKEAITFNEALSDTELEALTSYDSFTEMATEQLYTLK